MTFTVRCQLGRVSLRLGSQPLTTLTKLTTTLLATAEQRLPALGSGRRGRCARLTRRQNG